MEQDIFQKMKEKWPSALVARTEIGKFTGGLISPRTMANMDSLGKGPKQKVFRGNKVAYDVDVLVEWFKDNCRIVAS
jgi:hypothetical protein